jgi:hypothetical protein
MGKATHMGITTWEPVSISSITIKTVMGISISFSISISRPLAIMKTRITKGSGPNIAGSMSWVPSNSKRMPKSNNTMRLSRPLAEVSMVSIKSIAVSWIAESWIANIRAGKGIWMVSNPKTISAISIVTIVGISISLGISLGISLRYGFSFSIGVSVSLAKMVRKTLDSLVDIAVSCAMVSNSWSIAISTGITITMAIQTTVTSIQTIESVSISIC